jgi:hypothetical protein
MQNASTIQTQTGTALLRPMVSPASDINPSAVPPPVETTIRRSSVFRRRYGSAIITGHSMSRPRMGKTAPPLRYMPASACTMTPAAMPTAEASTRFFFVCARDQYSTPILPMTSSEITSSDQNRKKYDSVNMVAAIRKFTGMLNLKNWPSRCTSAVLASWKCAAAASPRWSTTIKHEAAEPAA